MSELIIWGFSSEVYICMMGIVRFFVPSINNRKMYSARNVHILHPDNIFVHASMIHMGDYFMSSSLLFCYLIISFVLASIY